MILHLFLFIRVILTEEFLFDFNVEREGGVSMKLFSLKKENLSSDIKRTVYSYDMNIFTLFI